ncbi:protein LEG1 homolog isoform X3 [Notamacropus eugenii]|uniref:protein LEG1 homolog isoform X3 n=1 Tax=Notamacropus eugenii TaxID=9315 RepID=UPI003B67BA95
MVSQSVWSSLTTLLAVFLCFFPTRSAIAENYAYPYLWDQVPRSVEDLPVKDNKIIMDPWNYTDRLIMYKLILNYSAKYFTQFGINNTGNVFWALSIFNGKLYETGRYNDPSNYLVNGRPQKKNFISIKGGWGGITYHVTIPFFLAALKLNFFGPLPYPIELLQQEERRSDFCYSFDECNASYPQMIASALRIFKYLQSREKKSNNSENPTYNTDMEKITHYMWWGHQKGVDAGKPLFYDKQLTIGDWFIPGLDFNISEKVLLITTKTISGLNSISGGAFFNIWKKIMMSETARKDAQVLVKIIFLFPRFISPDN